MAAPKSTGPAGLREYFDLAEWGAPNLEPGDLDYPPIVVLGAATDPGRARVEARENAIIDAWIGGEIRLEYLRWPEQTWEIPTAPWDRRSCQLDLRSKSLTLWPDPQRRGAAIVGYQVRWCWLKASPRHPLSKETIRAQIIARWQSEVVAGKPLSGRDELVRVLGISKESVQEALDEMPDEWRRRRGRPKKSAT